MDFSFKTLDEYNSAVLDSSDWHKHKMFRSRLYNKKLLSLVFTMKDKGETKVTYNEYLEIIKFTNGEQ